MPLNNENIIRRSPNPVLHHKQYIGSCLIVKLEEPEIRKSLFQRKDMCMKTDMFHGSKASMTKGSLYN